MTAATTQTRDGPWVHLYGELDLAGAPDAEAAIAAASTLGERLTIDLRGLEFIDSSGIALLVRANRRGQRQGRTLIVVASHGPVTRLLELCGLDRQLGLVDGAAL